MAKIIDQNTIGFLHEVIEVEGMLDALENTGMEGQVITLALNIQRAYPSKNLYEVLAEAMEVAGMEWL